MLRAVVLVLLLSLCALPAWADEVVLKDGRRYRGKVQRLKKAVKISDPLRVVTVPAAGVLRIEKTTELDAAPFERVTGPVGRVDPKLHAKPPVPLQARPVGMSRFSPDGKTQRRLHHPKHGVFGLTYQLTEVHPSHYVLEGIERRHRIHMACDGRKAAILHRHRSRGLKTDDPEAWLEMARFSRLAGWLDLARRDLAKAADAAGADAERAALDRARVAAALSRARVALARHDGALALQLVNDEKERLGPEGRTFLAELETRLRHLAPLRHRLGQLYELAGGDKSDPLAADITHLTQEAVEPELARKAMAILPKGEETPIPTARQDVRAELERLRLVVRYGRWLDVATLRALDPLDVRKAETLLGKLIAVRFDRQAVDGFLADELADLKLSWKVWAAIVRGGGGTQFWSRAGAKENRRQVELPGGVKVEYVMHVPPTCRPGVPAPLLIVLHGQGERPESMLLFWKAFADRHGVLLASVEYVVHQRPGYQHSWEEHRAVLRSLEDVALRHAVDPDRVFVSGHSLGGHAAFDVALSHPDRFAGAIPIIGSQFAFGRHYRRNSRHLPLFVIDGQHDFDWTARNRKHTAAMQRRGHDVTYSEIQTRGHEGFYEELPWVGSWLLARRRDPFPRRLELRSGRETDLRRFWVQVEDVTRTFPRLAPTDRVPDRWVVTLEARVKGRSELKIDLEGARAATVFLSDELVDLDRPIKIRLNRRAVFKGRITRSVPHLLRDFLQRADRRMLCAAAIRVETK